VGFICPFTGGSADFGTAARLGAELAVGEINQAGGYLGRPLELVARDDKSSPDEGRKIAEELVQGKKADFTIGFCNSGVALKALEVFQNAHHLLMIPVATGTALTTQFPSASSFIFRVSPRDALQAAFLVDEVQRRGLSKVAVFADKTGYGEGGLKDVERFLAQKGLKPVYVARFDLGTASLTAQMREAKAAGPRPSSPTRSVPKWACWPSHAPRRASMPTCWGPGRWRCARPRTGAARRWKARPWRRPSCRTPRWSAGPPSSPGCTACGARSRWAR
jgi:ABC-type branched-subunit amino acid transport system substrate-binding protein